MAEYYIDEYNKKLYLSTKLRTYSITWLGSLDSTLDEYLNRFRLYEMNMSNHNWNYYALSDIISELYCITVTRAQPKSSWKKPKRTVYCSPFYNKN